MTVKYRNGFDGQGGKDASFLDTSSTVPYLKKRRIDPATGATVVAHKRGEFLEVTMEGGIAYPPLLGVYRVNGTTPANARLKSRPDQRKVAIKTPAMHLVEGQAKPMPASSVYVGDGYILRLMFADRKNSAPGGVHGSAFIWPVLHRVGNDAPEVLSQSAENVPGANVSFADVATFEVLFHGVIGTDGLEWRSSEPERWPSIYAMGHDGATFKFGMLMGGVAGGNFSFVGDTTARRMVGTALPFDLPNTLQWWDIRAWAVGRGHVLALLPPAPKAGGLPPPNPPRMLRTADFGATWTLEPCPELLPFMSYWVIDGGPDDGQMRFLVDDGIGIRTFIAQPIGGGRVAIVVRGGEQTIYPDASTEGRVKWMFFVSDATGRNFVRVTWPLDNIAPDSNQGMYERRPFEPNPPFALDPVPALWQTERELSCQHMSAGPGTFFFSMSTEQNATLQRTWIVSTRDYGATWQQSPDLPQEALSLFPLGVKPGRFPQATPRPIAPGVLAVSSVAIGGTVRVFRTTAAFEGFAKASETTIPNLAQDVPGNLEPYCSKPVFVGTKESGRAFIHPGFPGMFDKD